MNELLTVRVAFAAGDLLKLSPWAYIIAGACLVFLIAFFALLGYYRSFRKREDKELFDASNLMKEDRRDPSDVEESDNPYLEPVKDAGLAGIEGIDRIIEYSPDPEEEKPVFDEPVPENLPAESYEKPKPKETLRVVREPLEVVDGEPDLTYVDVPEIRVFLKGEPVVAIEETDDATVFVEENEAEEITVGVQYAPIVTISYEEKPLEFAEKTVAPAPAPEPIVEPEPVPETEPEPQPEPVVEPEPEPEEESDEEETAETFTPAQTTEEFDPEKFGQRVVDGQLVLVRYRHSFTSRLTQAEPPIQDHYTAVKNYLLSFRGVKERMSWNFETFSKGRQQLARINVKGKTLLVYLALDPAKFDYAEQKYHFKDVGNKPKFEKTPMLMRVRSDRALRYVIELIDEMMTENEIEAIELKNDDYHIPYADTETLVDRGLVKIIYPEGTVITPDTVITKASLTEVFRPADTQK